MTKSLIDLLDEYGDACYSNTDEAWAVRNEIVKLFDEHQKSDAEPVGYVSGWYGGYPVISVIGGTMLPIGTPIYTSQGNNWEPSDQDYDRSIHLNPDAMAWAEFFLDTFPNCGADKGLMVGWFANAMMAMYDYQEQKRKPIGYLPAYAVRTISNDGAWDSFTLSRERSDPTDIEVFL